MSAKIITPDQLSSADTDLPADLRAGLKRAEEASKPVIMTVGDVIGEMQVALLRAFNLAAGAVGEKIAAGEKPSVTEATALLSAQGQAASGFAALAAEQRAQNQMAQQAQKTAASDSKPGNTGQYL